MESRILWVTKSLIGLLLFLYPTGIAFAQNSNASSAPINLQGVGDEGFSEGSSGSTTAPQLDYASTSVKGTKNENVFWDMDMDGPGWELETCVLQVKTYKEKEGGPTFVEPIVLCSFPLPGEPLPGNKGLGNPVKVTFTLHPKGGSDVVHDGNKRDGNDDGHWDCSRFVLDQTINPKNTTIEAKLHFTYVSWTRYGMSGPSTIGDTHPDVVLTTYLPTSGTTQAPASNH
jgi:hypothetical protein